MLQEKVLAVHSTCVNSLSDKILVHPTDWLYPRLKSNFKNSLDLEEHLRPPETPDLTEIGISWRLGHTDEALESITSQSVLIPVVLPDEPQGSAASKRLTSTE
ncbi:unnamed protein product [Allacma fusca]|uniref:Uncharacterized protein n=1 Tax=Allacma fusca TaxID=39272 RepID=A0A8J2K8L2_9HEXA|nr:unnamed protein product [Allacma fusca]